MKAFTLVEILVASIIMSVIMAVLFIVLSIGQRSWVTGDTAIELRDQTIRAVMTMDRELSATSPTKINLNIGASGNSLTFWLPFDNNGDGSVVDTSGNIEWTGAITYSLNGSNQIMRSFGATSSVLGNNIVSLQFTRTGDRLIQVDIMAQKTPSRGQQIQDPEQAIIKLRN